VVDLGAGTGKLTRELRPRVGRVIAVEPSAAMREVLRSAVPEVEALDGSAEELRLGDASVDAVFVGDAFHWFSTPAAVAEMARVVRPGGGLALMWNAHAWGDEPWLREMGELIGPRSAPGVRPENRYQSGLWRQALDGAPFGELHTVRVRHELRTDLPGLLLHISTWSFVGALDDRDRDDLLRELEGVLQRALPDPDHVTIPYRTDAYWARRLEA
jgi:SAM-dependent methyltransferase